MKYRFLLLITACCLMSKAFSQKFDTVTKLKLNNEHVVILKDTEKSGNLNSWEIFNELLQTVSAITVVVTLLYLAKQNKIAMQNTALGSFQHVYNHLNDFNVAINQSSDLAKIMVSGRISFNSLSADEKIRFEHTYGWLANILEGWLILINESMMSGEFKNNQLQNISAIIDYYFKYSGVNEFWSGYQSMYSPQICAMINNALIEFNNDNQYNV